MHASSDKLSVWGALRRRIIALNNQDRQDRRKEGVLHFMSGHMFDSEPTPCPQMPRVVGRVVSLDSKKNVALMAAVVGTTFCNRATISSTFILTTALWQSESEKQSSRLMEKQLQKVRNTESNAVHYISILQTSLWEQTLPLYNLKHLQLVAAFSKLTSRASYPTNPRNRSSLWTPLRKLRWESNI